MKHYNIALLAGDGIGREIIAEGVKVLESVSKDFKLNFTEYPAGTQCFLDKGETLPSKTLDGCRNSHAIFLGAMGLPNVRDDSTGQEVGNEAVLKLRFSLDLFAGVRPVKLYQGINSILKNNKFDIDYVIVRENTEGLYASFKKGVVLRDEVATDIQIITRNATERIMDFSFNLAKDRENSQKKGRESRVTCVDKSNVLSSSGFWRKIYDERATQYPNILQDYAYVDAMTAYMVQKPYYFDVVVADNMFGDIISDLGSATIGGLGISSSGDIGEKNGLFQPVHGSAPDIAGQNIANPIAQILSGRMMLDWMGKKYKDQNLIDASNKIEGGVKKYLISDYNLPKDLGGTAKTNKVGDYISQIVRDL